MLSNNLLMNLTFNQNNNKSTILNSDNNRNNNNNSNTNKIEFSNEIGVPINTTGTTSNAATTVTTKKDTEILGLKPVARKNRGKAGRNKDNRGRCRSSNLSITNENIATVVLEKDNDEERSFMYWWQEMEQIQSKNITNSSKLIQVALLTLQFCQHCSTVCAMIDNNYNICCEFAEKRLLNGFDSKHRLDRFWQLLDYFTACYDKEWIDKIGHCKQQSAMSLNGFEAISLWLNKDVALCLGKETVLRAYNNNDIAAKKLLQY